MEKIRVREVERVFIILVGEKSVLIIPFSLDFVTNLCRQEFLSFHLIFE